MSQTKAVQEKAAKAQFPLKIDLTLNYTLVFIDYRLELRDKRFVLKFGHFNSLFQNMDTLLRHFIMARSYARYAEGPIYRGSNSPRALGLFGPRNIGRSDYWDPGPCVQVAITLVRASSIYPRQIE